jgi:hypothetical protein
MNDGWSELFAATTRQFFFIVEYFKSNPHGLKNLKLEK